MQQRNKPQTLKEGLYMILKLNGAFNMKAAILLQGQNYNSTASTLTKLRKRMAIERYKGINYFPNVYAIEQLWNRCVAEELRDNCVANENRENCKLNLKSVGGRSRLAEQAEIMAIMIRCDISLYNQWEYGYKNFYVASRKIKSYVEDKLNEEKTYAIKRAKVKGTYRRSKEVMFNLYSTKDLRIKWDKISENMYTECIKDMSQNETGVLPEVKAIVFVQSINKFENIVQSRNQKKKKGKKEEEVITNIRLYDEILVLERSEAGIEIMNFLKNENLKQTLNEYLYKDGGSGNNFCDNIEKREKETVVSLNFLYPDIVKLRKFFLYRMYKSDENEKFEIHCYDEYKKGIEEVTNGQIEIITHSSDEIKKLV